MAAYTISTAVTTAGTAQKINTNDTVTVTSSGSLNGTGATGVGILSHATGGATGGFDTLSISGEVRGSLYGFDDIGAGGNDIITVNSGGSIFGGHTGVTPGDAILIAGGSNTISNAGRIADNLGGHAIQLNGGSDSINNTGTISSTGSAAIRIVAGGNTIDNGGTISTNSQGILINGGGSNDLTNSGAITADIGISVSGNANSVTNSGTISTSYTGIDMIGNHNAVTNTGTISALMDDGCIRLDGNSSSVTNSGMLADQSYTGVTIDGTKDVLHNTAAGTITGGELGINADPGKSTVIVNAGAIIGGSDGVDLSFAPNAVVKVLAGGSITGTTGDGIFASGDGLHIIDKGTISGVGTDGLEINGIKNVIKVSAHGMLSGGLHAIHDHTGTSDHIFNAGTIQSGDGTSVEVDGSAVHLHNSGIITSASTTAIAIYGGSNRITNKGTISGVNTGIYLEDGKNVVTNLSGGVIKGSADSSGDSAVHLGNGGDTVTNSGTIFVALHGNTSDAAIAIAGSGTNTIVNNAGGLISDYHAGQTSNDAIFLAGGKNAVVNDGRIVGSIHLGSNATADSYAGSDGAMKGTIFGGSGADTIVLGHGRSNVVGGLGADSITAGAQANDFGYHAAADSNINAYDAIDGFQAGHDTLTFDTGHALSGVDSVTVSSLSGVDEASLQAATAGHLDAWGAVILTVSSGLYSGDAFLLVDADGNAGFDSGGAGTDYLVVLTHVSGTLSAADILTTT